MRCKAFVSSLFVVGASPAHGIIIEGPYPTLEREVRPGILYRYFSTEDNKRIHVAEVDLRVSNLQVRASLPDEKGLVPTEFARRSGAVVAINGDFFNGQRVPVGLAVGAGVVWNGSADTDVWSFLACSTTGLCEIDVSGTARERQPEWSDVVGGWQVLLKEGFTWSGADDAACGEFCTVSHPRTAVGLDTFGSTLFLVLVEGRQGAITGFTLARLAQFMKGLGAATALNLDGGGSSGMVIDGRLVNGRPLNEPNERPVSNCLGIYLKAFSGSPSPARLSRSK